MMHQLSKHSRSVAFSGKHRTRLRLPRRYCGSEAATRVASALSRMPYVREVHANPRTGTIAIDHEETPDILPNISRTIAHVAPDLLVALESPQEGEEGLFASISSTVRNIVSRGASESAQGQAPSAVIPQGMLRAAVPLLFVGAAAMRIVEKESLLAGASPVLLLFLAYEFGSRMNLRRRLGRIEDAVIPQRVRTI